MDFELASAVFRRWEDGLPVSETNLYKAASVIGVDPDAVLTEARFLTAFDKYAAAQRPMTQIEFAYFSLAAGVNPYHLEKTASRNNLDPEELLVEKLRSSNFKADLEKIALMLPPEAIQEMLAQQQAQGGGGDPSQGGAPGGQGQDPQAAAEQAAAPQGPQAGAQVQQDPSQRYKPAPTAPDQITPSSSGNLDALLQEQQGIYGQQAQDNGGLPPSGQEEPAPPPPSPEERIQQVAPGMDPETTQRYAAKLQEFEQQSSMPISDPKQMVKFVEGLQKVDVKYLDQGIKQFMQDQEAQAGIGQTVDQPTVAGFGPQAGGDEAQAGQQTGQPQAPGAQAAGQEAGETAGAKPGQQPSAGQPAPKKPKPVQAGAPSPQAEKVAQVGRLLARLAVNG